MRRSSDKSTKRRLVSVQGLQAAQQAGQADNLELKRGRGWVVSYVRRAGAGRSGLQALVCCCCPWLSPAQHLQQCVIAHTDNLMLLRAVLAAEEVAWTAGLIPADKPPAR